MTVRLFSYIPLVLAQQVSFRGLSKQSACAAINNGVQPFVDASCVEEPSLSSPRPAITSVCRPRKGLPNWQPGDIIVYWTNGWITVGGNNPVKYITAVLRITSIEPTHSSAVAVYAGSGLSIPGNVGNPVLTSVGLTRCAVANCAEERIRMSLYNNRIKAQPHVAITCPIYLNTHTPIAISQQQIESCFGQIPKIQNGMTLNTIQANALLRLVRAAGFSCPM